VLAAVILAGLWGLSLHVARFTCCTDFPVFYAAARSVLEDHGASASLYHPHLARRYPIPEEISAENFIYSKPAAFLMAPLGLLPYYPAKATMILLNLLAYGAAVGLLLQGLGATERWLFYPLGSSLLFTPFLQTLRYGQTNGLLLLFIVASAWLAMCKRDFAAGALLGAAMLFKLFPAVIALVAGMPSRRIWTGAAVLFGLNFAVPGAFDWFAVIPSVDAHFTSVIWRSLQDIGPVCVGAYLFLVLVIAVCLAGQATDVFFRYAYGTAVMFLLMPVFSYSHLVFWIVPILLVGWRCRKWYAMVPLSLAVLLLMFPDFRYLPLAQLAVTLMMWMLLSIFGVRRLAVRTEGVRT
jgi:hypothetical protein